MAFMAPSGALSFQYTFASPPPLHAFFIRTFKHSFILSFIFCAPITAGVTSHFSFTIQTILSTLIILDYS
jgi:hypothetical protein